MATSIMSGGDPALLSQCLEFCQALASMGQTIPFSVTLASTLIFNLDTSVKATSSDMKITKKKKPSASFLRRNIQRKREFLKQKREISNDIEATSLTDVHVRILDVLTPTTARTLLERLRKKNWNFRTPFTHGLRHFWDKTPKSKYKFIKNSLNNMLSDLSKSAFKMASEDPQKKYC